MNNLYAGWIGILVGGRKKPVIQNNTIEGTDDAITFFDKSVYDSISQQVLKDNIFKNNTENVLYNSNPD